jgi:SNF2 family DNA or RNA helicase
MVEMILNLEFKYKNISFSELKEIFSNFNWKCEPRWHQYVSLLYAADDRDRLCYFHDVGTGKTPLGIMTAKYLWGAKKILVVCPSSAFGAWEKDIPQFTNYSHTILTGTSKQRLKELKKWDKDVYIINYEGLKTIFATLFKKTAAGNGGGWRIDNSKFNYYFDCIIFDEVHKCKNYSALQTKICAKLSRQSKHAIGLTGTPIDNSLLEAFQIMNVVDLGKSLGTNFFTFRFNYFDKKRYDWILRNGAKNKILEKMKTSSISFSAEECYDLPEIQEQELILQPTAEYKTLLGQIRHNNRIKFKNKHVEFLNSSGEISDQKCLEALRQIACGFFYDQEKNAVLLSKQPKAKAIVDKLEDSNSKIIIFYHYKAEKIIYEKELSRAKIGFLSMYGGQDLNERRKFEKQFHKDPKIRVIIAQKSVANEGFDGTAATIIVHTTPVGSPKIRKQCKGRIRRANQKAKHLFAYDLVLLQSVDERIIQNRGPRFSFVKDCMDFLKDG